MAYKIYAPNRMNGRSTWIELVSGQPDSTPPGAEAYCHYLTDYRLVDQRGETVPCEVALSYANGMDSAFEGIDGLPWVGYVPAYLHLTLPEAAMHYGLDCRFEFTMNCVPAHQPLENGGVQQIVLPLLIAPQPLASACSRPAIPGVLAWEDYMVELADHWAPQLLDPNNTLGDSNWYYDIASTYWQIGDYVRRSNAYAEVALASINRYEQYLLTSNPPGCAAVWAVFPRGLRQTYERTQEAHWADTMKLMTSCGWVACAGNPDPSSMRETAYSSDVWRELTYLDAGDPVMLEKSVEFLLGQLNLLFAQETGKGEGMVCEPFMFGLAAQSLIDYFDLTEDERIPEALIAATRYIWDHGVNEKTGYVMYDLWTPGGINHDNQIAYTSLNGMMFNAWGFLYAVTGNDLYRQQGDILFEHQFDDGGYSWSPKQFAQCYRRSIDYVTRWRA